MQRRKFLTNGLTAIGSIPFLDNTFGNNFNFGLANEYTKKITDKANDHVLVVIQLAGGNDGLNTIVPLETMNNMWQIRQNIYLEEKIILRSKVANKIAFHPKMTALFRQFENKKVRLINSVGYPTPNFSHFKSSDIWMAASGNNNETGTGWLGRYLENDFPNFPKGYPNEAKNYPPAISTTPVIQLITQGNGGNLAVSYTTRDTNLNLKNDLFETDYGSVQEKVEFLNTLNTQTNFYGNYVNSKASNEIRQKEYPNTAIGGQLKNIARLIANGISTKIYLATQNGYDTHANQTEKVDTENGVHGTLVKDLSDAIGAFQEDLAFLGISKRVIGMTYSEFGRRVGSNSSLGTDHGTAAPMFVFGDQALSGMLGDAPRIPSYPSPSLNLTMQYDFRSVFSSVLKDWFCVKDSTLENIFYSKYQYLPIVANYDCNGITGTEITDPPKNPIVAPIDTFKVDNPSVKSQITANESNLKEGKLLAAYPNPFIDKFTLEFASQGGFCKADIYDVTGKKVANILKGNYLKGIYKTNVEALNLNSGSYFIRYENGSQVKLEHILKY